MDTGSLQLLEAVWKNNNSLVILISYSISQSPSLSIQSTSEPQELPQQLDNDAAVISSSSFLTRTASTRRRRPEVDLSHDDLDFTSQLNAIFVRTTGNKFAYVVLGPVPMKTTANILLEVTQPLLLQLLPSLTISPNPTPTLNR